MARIDPQTLVDRLMELVLMPAVSIDITERDGKRRDINFTDLRMLVQRRRVGIDGDVGQWDTVIRINTSHIDLIEDWVAVAQILDPAVDWRLTDHTGLVPTEDQSRT